MSFFIWQFLQLLGNNDSQSRVSATTNQDSPVLVKDCTRDKVPDPLNCFLEIVLLHLDANVESLGKRASEREMSALRDGQAGISRGTKVYEVSTHSLS